MLIFRRKYKKIENYFHKSEHFNREDLVPVLIVFSIAIIFGILAVGSSAFALRQKKDSEKKERQALQAKEAKQLGLITTKLESVPDETAGWKVYASQDYDFEIKYPSDWNEPQAERAVGSISGYSYKISFRPKNDNPLEKYNGFDIFIFEGDKFSNPQNTVSLSQKPGASGIDPSLCSQPVSAEIGVGGYQAKEMNVPPDDPYYKQTFFYSLTKNGFTYQLVPIEKSEYAYAGYSQKADVTRDFPKFYRIVSTFKFDGTIPQSAAATFGEVRKKISPPRVFVAKARCTHKNDHPRKSRQGKGRHMDEDCCMDPDEWPNPRCAY